MKFQVLSLMPELVQQSLAQGLVGAAFDKSLCSLQCLNPRDFTTDVHQSVDDRPFGGGDGMLMTAEPLQKALDHLEDPGRIFVMSPHGRVFGDSMAKELSECEVVTLVCGRYAGIDQRFVEHNNIEELSIGDFVLSGGELAASVVIDCTVRHIPGVLGHANSAQADSFKNDLLECPQLTRPREWQGMSLPEVLLSGDHKKIQNFSRTMEFLVTLQKRPDLLATSNQIPWPACLTLLESLDDGTCRSLGLRRESLLEMIKERSHE